MPLNKAIRSYLFNSPFGRLIAGNAIGGARFGLYSKAATIDYARAAYAQYRDLKIAGVISGSVQDFEDCLANLRFQPFEAGKRRQINSDVVPLFSLNKPNLSRRRLATVIELQILPQLMSRDDKDRIGIELSISGKPKDPDQLARKLKRLGVSGRRFQLADGEFLGRKLVWLTPATEARRLRKSCTDTNKMAEHFCDGLGLGHHPPGTWLVMLTIPGSAVQKAWHYRPVFCDAGTSRWFMTKSSQIETLIGPWGQTAELQSLANGNIDYDGGPERVSRQVAGDHLDGATINFDLLGEVKTTNANDTAERRLSIDVWTRRR